MMTLVVGYSMLEKDENTLMRHVSRNVTGILDDLAGVGDLECQLPLLYAEIKALLQARMRRVLAERDGGEKNGQESSPVANA